MSSLCHLHTNQRKESALARMDFSYEQNLQEDEMSLIVDALRVAKRSLFSMLPSSKRLTIPLFKTVLEKGKIFHSSLFIFKAIKIEGQSRFSVSVSKKVAKNAVLRNKIRRRVYSNIASVYPSIVNGIHGVFIAKSPIINSPFEEVASDLQSLFVKSGLLK